MEFSSRMCVVWTGISAVVEYDAIQYDVQENWRVASCMVRW